MKSILALAGSPHKKSSTHFLLAQVTEGACSVGANVKTIYASRKEGQGCIACYKCRESDQYACAVEDEVQDFLTALQDVQEIVIATPVYWFGPTAQIKRFIDRLFCFLKVDSATGQYKSSLNGKGLSLVVTAGGEAFDGADLIVEMMRRTASITGMTFRGTIGAYSVQGVEQLEQDAGLIASAKEFGRQLAS